MYNENTASGQSSLWIFPIKMNYEIIFSQSGFERTSIEGIRGKSYVFTYYTSNNPYNTTSATYPNWTCDTSTYVGFLIPE